jgi:hypothetical protein
LKQLQEQALETAIQTMRKSFCFSRNTNPVDFEWPKPSDLRKMSNTALIKVAKLNYKINSSHATRFRAFKIVFSNGESSPVFLSKD